MIKLHTQRAQTIIPEYVVAFFVVMSAMVAVTVYVQRSLQARVRDARNYAMDQAAAGCTAVGAGCLQAAGGAVVNGTFVKEYEPYYGMASSIITRTHDEQKGMTGGDFIKNSTTTTRADTTSSQLLPQEEQ